MRSYAVTFRDRIPLTNYHSSWYWFRKEHQTRLEFALRSIKPPALNHATQGTRESGPTYMETTEGKIFIFRYDKREHIRQIIEQGRVRFSPAKVYEDEENNVTRRDDELQRNSYLFDQHLTLIHGESGLRIDIPFENLQRAIPRVPYHLVCFSCIWDAELFSDFKADTCVAVTDPREFINRLKATTNELFPNRHLKCGAVRYFDPYECRENVSIDSTDPAMYKNFQFAYQHEYRVILWPDIEAPPVDGFQFVNIGPVQDIMKMYDKDEEVT